MAPGVQAHGDQRVECQFNIFIYQGIANNKDMCAAGYLMEWGYSLSNGKKVINARSEHFFGQWVQ